MAQPTLAFIGAGNMATSLIRGLLHDNFPADNLWASDPSQDKLQSLEQSLHIHTTQDNEQALTQADILILATKPQHITTICKQLALTIQQQQPLVISIAAGVPVAVLEKYLGKTTAIVRCMPNTPALVGSGASGLFANTQVSEQQKAHAESILRAVGITQWVDDEKLMDVITALSGSGPAYIFLIMQALQEAAQQLGLEEEAARLLSIQTTLGTAHLALESSHSLDLLIQQVTSPGGTTESALAVLTQAQVKDIFLKAVTSAKERAEEIAASFNQQ